MAVKKRGLGRGLDALLSGPTVTSLEEQAVQACKNIKRQDVQQYGGGACCGLCVPKTLSETWWPWGAGIPCFDFLPKSLSEVMMVALGTW